MLPVGKYNQVIIDLRVALEWTYATIVILIIKPNTNKEQKKKINVTQESLANYLAASTVVA